ncbi:MAG: glycosyltransferase [Bdellovibrionales bacterium]
MKFAVCCIISKNYLAHARTALKSFAKFHQNFESHVLILDDWKDYFDESQESFKSYSVADIGVSTDQYCRILHKHSVFQVSCIFKSCFVRFLLKKQGVQRLLYLDADIFFLSSITDTLEKLRTNNLVLTPHLLNRDPYQSEELIRLEAQTNAAGVFNMGFFGISKSRESFEFLDWWWRRVLTYCERDVPSGLFDDQKWIDAVPAMFEGVSVARDPGYNVANWNLHERDLTLLGGKYFAGRRKLAFFHFSKFRPDQAYRLSSYSLVDTRRHVALKNLCASYVTELKRNGWEQTSKWPFSLIHEI